MTVANPTSHGHSSSSMEEGVLWLSERPAARHFRQFSEERLVHPEVTELLGIGHHQGRELRPDHLICPALRHADQIDALLRRREPTTVATEPHLVELDDASLLIRGDNAHL
jgi:hypothetical protein